MDVQRLVDTARDTLTVRRVFGDPYTDGAVTVIPVAHVRGGGGGGEGTEGEGGNEGKRGSGAGFGMNARAAGVFVLRDGEVSWRPAVDVNRLVTGAQVVAVVALLTARAVAKARLASRTAD